MSANDGDDSKGRNLSFYDGDVLFLTSNITRSDSAVKLKVQAPNSGIGTMSRFPLGSYIQVDDEIMRVSTSTLSA